MGAAPDPPPFPSLAVVEEEEEEGVVVTIRGAPGESDDPLLDLVDRPLRVMPLLLFVPVPSWSWSVSGSGGSGGSPPVDDPPFITASCVDDEDCDDVIVTVGGVGATGGFTQGSAMGYVSRYLSTFSSRGTAPTYSVSSSTRLISNSFIIDSKGGWKGLEDGRERKWVRGWASRCEGV